MTSIIQQIKNLEADAAVEIEAAVVRSRKDIADYKKSIEDDKREKLRSINERCKKRLDEAVAEAEGKADEELKRVAGLETLVSNEILSRKIKDEILATLFNI